MQQHVQGVSRERMLREMAEVAELFTVQRGLVIVLEDLHWSDVSTLNWLTYLAISFARLRGKGKAFSGACGISARPGAHCGMEKTPASRLFLGRVVDDDPKG